MDSDSDLGESYQVEEENNFISQLLVEMKSQFNMFEKKAEENEGIVQKNEPDSSQCLSTEVSTTVNVEDLVADIPEEEPLKEEPENSGETVEEVQTEEKSVQVSSPNIELDSELNNSTNENTTDLTTDTSKEIDANSSDLDEKPLTEIKKLAEESATTELHSKPQELPSPTKRLPRTKNSNDEQFRIALKRSKRHRSKESILQSAIARKEKFYNEATNKPQRLTRRLKPTQKILDNLANARRKTKHPRSKYSDEDLDSEQEEESDTSLKNKRSLKRNGKRIKCDPSSDSDQDSVLQDNENMVPKRRSQRISSNRNKEEIDSDNTNSTTNIADEAKHSPNQPECSSVTSQLITSRLCLCTQNTRLFRDADEKEEVFCSAVDGIGDKLIGCSRLVNCKNSSMLRSSQRMPYGVFCDTHKNRLIRHNCCPTCGVFCTQGKFAECQAKHQYHKNCQISVGNLECCPHCGVSTPSRDIFITMHSAKKPIFLPTQKSNCLSAKMTFHTHQNYPTRSNSPIVILPENLENITNIETNGQHYDENDLIEAVANEDCEKVVKIIGSGLDLSFKLSDFNEGTILHFAAQAGLLSMVQLLVLSKMEMDEFDVEQNTALMLSVTESKNDVVQYLVKAGASMTLKGTDGMTALHLAAKSGNLEACQILVKAGCTISNYVNARDDGGWTPLVWACEHGFLDVATFLILKGADHSLRDVEHNVALHWAAFSGSTNIAELLLNLGCDVNSVNAHGDTPLHIAAREDRYNCSIVLLARGANVSLINKNNETALDCAPENSDTYTLIALNVRLNSVTGFSDNKKSILTNDISRGRETNPIQCVNTTDTDSEPKDFVYITKNRMTSDNVLIDTKLATVHSCSCEERCVDDECACARISLKCWYDQDGNLKPDFSFVDSPLIFECNETCACNAITCVNRVIQKGYTQRFQVFKTDSKGWGVKTLRSIPKGGYVCEYVGEILTDSDGELREDDSYLFDLDNRDTDSFCIDAKYYGNFARFINHSCDPNLHPVKVFVEHQDLRFPRIALFARREIAVNEELSFDYGDKFWLIKYKSFTCDCRAKCCKYSEVSIDETLEKYKELMEISSFPFAADN